MATTFFSIKELTQGQAQKEITHNEALRVIDVLLTKSVISSVLTAEPATPADGDFYIVAAGATGAWAGQDNNLALYINAAWIFVTPPADLILFDKAAGNMVKFSGGSWTSFFSGVQNYTFTATNAAKTLAAFEAVSVDTLAASVTLTLPATPAAGDKVLIIDENNNFATNNCIVAGNGSKINNLATNLVLNVSGTNTTLQYIDAVKGWATV